MSFGFRFKATAAPLLLAVISVLGWAGCGGNNNPTITSPAPAANNTVAVSANFGPTGQSGGFINTIYTTVTVCQHGTKTCATIPNVAVDTGSIGLRLLPSALGSVALTPVLISGQPLQECIQFGDTSYTWGPMQFADVDIAGESASNVPVQLLEPSNFSVPADCLTMPVNSSLPNGGDVDTPQTVGANGILGIGDGTVDCGSFCAQLTQISSGYPYYTCPNGNCQEVSVSTFDQATNPVSAFASSDRNGVVITLPSVGATGATTVSGTMTFGIATQSDNVLGSATVYSLDQCGDFPTVTYDGLSYTDSSCSGTGSGLGGFLDTGSTGLYVADASTLSFLGISDCPQGTAGDGFYCVSPGPTATLSNIAISGNGLGAATTSLSLTIYDATKLISSNNAVFSDLGSDSGTSPSTDYFDFGAPFFLGRTVFVSIAGETVSGVLNAPNGFVAF